jgi:23S rRNA (guanosine2251-2'-O)-methyltransferase
MQFPKDVPVTLADVADLARLVPGDAPHQGVVIEVEPLEDMWLGDLLGDAPERAVLLVLDQVTDPHNVGAILRSAAAFGAVGIIECGGNRMLAPETGAVGIAVRLVGFLAGHFASLGGRARGCKPRPARRQASVG